MQKKYSFLDKLLRIVKHKLFKKGYHLPNWVVFLMDTFGVYICYLIAHILLIGVMNNTSYAFFSMYQSLAIISVHSLFFVISGTYKSSIRHFSFRDFVKKFRVLSTAVATIMIGNFIIRKLDQPLFLNTELLIGFVLSCVLVFKTRILVKFTYNYIMTKGMRNSFLKLGIVGATPNAISIAEALLQETSKRYELTAFLVSNTYLNTANKQVLGKPVILYQDLRMLKQTIKSQKLDAIVLANTNLRSDDLFALVDYCAEYNISVLNAPIVGDKSSKTVSKQIKEIRIDDLLNRKPIEIDDTAKKEEYRNKRILVTGAAGSIGSEILRQLFKYDPALVVLVDQAETPVHSISVEVSNKFPEANFEAVVADITNKKRLHQLFDRYNFDIVFHAAAYKHVPLMEKDPEEAIMVNIGGTKNLADLSVAFEVDKFVMVSTDKAVNPSNVMGASKRLAEMYVQSMFFKHQEQNNTVTKFITTRFGNVLGSNGSVVPLFKKQIEAGGPVTITHPDIIRYFMTIPEACNLVLEAGAMGNGGEIYLFDMGAPVKIMDLAKRMIKMYGYIPNKDIEIKVTGLRPGEKLYEELLSDKAVTMPTHNEKIMIGVERSLNYAEISAAVTTLLKSTLRDEVSQHELIKQIKMLVPEYKSLNSKFETLDK